MSTETGAFDGQCCSCRNWMPFQGDEEWGRCTLAPNWKHVDSQTGWSDGCQKWESNKADAA